MSRMILDGIHVIGGIGKGFAHFHRSSHYVQSHMALQPDSDVPINITAECNRLQEALLHLRHESDCLVEATDPATPSYEIVSAYRLLAHDRGWERRLIHEINQGFDVISALENVLSVMRQSFSKEAFWQSRLHEFDDLTNRLARYLVHSPPKKDIDLERPLVVIAPFLSPADLIDYHHHNLVALILSDNSYTSHVAIIAKSLQVPVITGVDSMIHLIKENDFLIVDGNEGRIHIRPTSEDMTITVSSGKKKAMIQSNGLDANYTKKPAVTLDGHPIRLSINANLPEDLTDVHKDFIDGVGLFRTEVPFMITNELPSVEGQVAFYKTILAQSGKKPLCFRTLDIGGDKVLSLHNGVQHIVDKRDKHAIHQPSVNGWRAIRLSLDRPMLLRQQIRAFLRAKMQSEHPEVPLSIMIPMVAEITEFLAIRKIIQLEVNREKLHHHGIAPRIHFGAMIEIPSIVYQLEQLLPLVDFLSIGTNDLQQFFFAFDRDAPEMSNRFDFLSPSFLMFIKQIVQTVGQRVPLSLCGEVASQPLCALALLGIGIRHFSIAPSHIEGVYAMIGRVNLESLKTYMDAACQHLLSPAMFMHNGPITLRHRLMNFAVDHGIITA